MNEKGGAKAPLFLCAFGFFQKNFKKNFFLLTKREQVHYYEKCGKKW